MDTEIFDLFTQYEEGMDRAAEVIRQGGLVGFPTETVYGLGADAMNEEAVRSIYIAKGRPSNNPLIVHICDMSQLDILVKDVPKRALELMERFWPGPFTAVLNKRPEVNSTVSGGLNTVAVRMPSNRYASELIRRSGRVIAAPSGNLSGKPSPTTAKHMKDDFMGKIPVILDGGRADVGVESTVCDLRGDVPVILRPGGITAEMIRSAAGSVEISGGVLKKLSEGEKALSPGMLYRHYSPKAEVYVAQGADEADTVKRINDAYDGYERQGRPCVIFCLDGNAGLYRGRNTYPLGKDAGQMASNLFDALRKADEDSMSVVLFEAVSLDGMGLAVMNRIIRAAGFKTI